MVEFLIFSVRYIPFWAVPFVLICIPFAYVFWLKDIRIISFLFLCVSMMSVLMIAFWVWAGGPDKAVQLFFDAVRSF